MFRRLALLGVVAAFAIWPVMAQEAEPTATTMLAGGLAAKAPTNSTADHSKFEALKGPFASGPEVTKACLTCHNKAGHQVMDSIHWKWEAVSPTTGKTLGKKNAANNFCGSILSNEPRCTSCHAGYGWTDKNFDFAKQENVDCLACHDTTKTYKKVPTDAGHPLYSPRETPKGSGKIAQPPDLTKIAQSIGKSSRDNCGACHYNGGGGDAVKHGDLDTSLNNPPKSLDIHMARDGLNMSCATCHTFNAHQPSGSRYAATAKDAHGIDLPKDDHNRATCELCHGATPHKEAQYPRQQVGAPDLPCAGIRARGHRHENAVGLVDSRAGRTPPASPSSPRTTMAIWSIPPRRAISNTVKTSGPSTSGTMASCGKSR